MGRKRIDEPIPFALAAPPGRLPTADAGDATQLRVDVCAYRVRVRDDQGDEYRMTPDQADALGWQLAAAARQLRRLLRSTAKEDATP